MGSGEVSDSGDEGALALAADVGSHAEQFGNVHEPAGEHLVGDGALAGDQAQQSGQLGLNIGWESGVGESVAGDWLK